MKKYLYLSIFIVLSIVVSCSNNTNTNDLVHEFKNTDLSGVHTPVVSFIVNGKNMDFIIDTGANMSLIDEDYYEKNDEYFSFIKEIDMTINGVSGGKNVTTKYIMAEIGDSIKVRQQFITSDLSGVISNIKNSCGISVVGIIGADYLNKHDMCIDFKNNIVYKNFTPIDSIKIKK